MSPAPNCWYIYLIRKQSKFIDVKLWCIKYALEFLLNLFDRNFNCLIFPKPRWSGIFITEFLVLEHNLKSN